MSNRTLALTDKLYQYLLMHMGNEPEVLKQLRNHTTHIELSQMQIAPEQGRFMAFLVKLMNVRKVIEVGVYTGYSSLSVAMAMPADGKIIACDVNEEWTNIARRFWEQAGVSHKIELRLAPAVETLANLIDQGESANYDMAFIDADKVNYRTYYEQCLKLIRCGGLILIDNTLWGGDVAEVSVKDEDTCAIREFNQFICQDKRVDMCMLPVADGLTLLRKC